MLTQDPEFVLEVICWIRQKRVSWPPVGHIILQIQVDLWPPVEKKIIE
jgi:hypothetical protein